MKIKMNHILFLITTIVLTVISVCNLLLADETNNFSGQDQRALFARFNIPDEIFCEGIALELHRMAWQIEVARSNNWQEATRHPALYKDGRDLSKNELMFAYHTLKKQDKFEFYTCVIEYATVANGDWAAYTDCLLNGTLRLDSNGNPETFHMFFNTYKFGDNGHKYINDGRSILYFPLPFEMYSNPKKYNLESDKGIYNNGYIEWQNGKVIYNDIIKNNNFFHDTYRKLMKEDLQYDLKPSVLNKKPIKPITLASEKDYTIRIPDNIDSDTRKVFFKVTRQYKILKDGNVKKLVEDIFPKRGEYTSGVVSFRFGKNYLYDVVYSNDSSGLVRGNYFKFDDKSHVTMWLNGDLRDIDDEDLRTLSDPLKVRYSIDGDGVVIHFHPTGFPKIYRTIIRNRL
ncbi:MAG: hypothetical protein LBF88_02010, partial [Planctomycetaceae bacterium]|nr:hypothetical protein [Planctomycetaceae bacterium]